MIMVAYLQENVKRLRGLPDTLLGLSADLSEHSWLESLAALLAIAL